MSTWIVLAAHRDSGKTTRLLIDASSAESAAEKAAREGYLVSGQPLPADGGIARHEAERPAASGDELSQSVKALGFAVSQLQADVGALRSAGIMRGPVIRIAVGVFLGLLFWGIFALLTWLALIALLGALIFGAGKSVTSGVSPAPSPSSFPPTTPITTRTPAPTPATPPTTAPISGTAQRRQILASIGASYRAWEAQNKSPVVVPAKLFDIVAQDGGSDSVVCLARLAENAEPSYIVLTGLKRLNRRVVAHGTNLGDMDLEALGSFECTTVGGMQTVIVVRVPEKL